ncbi:hypothetical protein EI981_02655 [Paenibacillus lutimineralis]|uniref:Rhamnogalacturonase A/B/Epimerase-like pectate lyase domain-containing protein n=1 Tax=Paenibacillus lutimineralis TaxID=2707005 RepID=A0A3S9UT71_9BACL|nr:hypothetical protein EI981_02655 [Paenibacillus lutimineralis]
MLVITHKQEEISVIDVKRAGARGDGKTDDTAVIQRALQQAAQSKDTVYFPDGVYIIDPARTLSVGSNTSILGNGKTSVIKAASSGFGWDMIRVQGSNININNISLDGNNRVNRVLAIGGGSSNIVINNSSVANATHSTDKKSDYYVGVVSGIVIYGNTNSITISNTEIYNVSATNVSEGSLIARGIFVTTTWGSKEKIGKKILISGCYIHHISPADDGDGIYYEDPAMDNNKGENTGSIIANNRFTYCSKRAIKIYAQGMQIQSNQIENPFLNNNYYKGTKKGTPAPDMYSAISIYGSNNVVVNNIINGVGSFYAAFEVSAGDLIENTLIQGNSISMGDKSNIAGTTAIRLGNVRGFQLLNNNISNGERGVWTWQNADQGMIQGNSIVVRKGTGIDLTTYLSGYVQKNITCIGNNITAGKAKIVIPPRAINIVIK